MNHPNCYAKSDEVIRFIKSLNYFPEYLNDILRQKMSDPYFQYEYADAQVIRSDDNTVFYVENCFGSFPYLGYKNQMRRLVIRNCIFTDITYECAEFPYWIENIRIENTYLPRLPKLSHRITSLVLRLTNLETIPELPEQLRHLILEHNNRLYSLPKLPNSLTHLYCFDGALTELPTLPMGLIKLRCWKNRLDELPPMPSAMNMINCAGNPFAKMPFIHELLHYPYADENAAVIGDLQLHPKVVNVIPRFREIYYAVRLREKFKMWFWRKREREARESLSPDNLAKYLEEHNSDDTLGGIDCATDEFFGIGSFAGECKR
jgi:hypothetical protein